MGGWVGGREATGAAVRGSARAGARAQAHSRRLPGLGAARALGQEAAPGAPHATPTAHPVRRRRPGARGVRQVAHGVESQRLVCPRLRGAGGARAGGAHTRTRAYLVARALGVGAGAADLLLGLGRLGCGRGRGRRRGHRALTQSALSLSVHQWTNRHGGTMYEQDGALPARPACSAWADPHPLQIPSGEGRGVAPRELARQRGERECRATGARFRLGAKH